MRYFFLLVTAAFLLTNCSPTENLNNQREISSLSGTDEEAPGWYERNVKSKSDTVSFYGYSHVSASGEQPAREQAEKLAIENLRYEIDRFADEVRDRLAEEQGADPFGTHKFIVELRNAIQNLDLADAERSYDSLERDEVHHQFARAELSRQTVIEKLTSAVSNTTFTSALVE